MSEQGGGGADRDPRGRDHAPRVDLWLAVLLLAAGAAALVLTYDARWLCGGLDLTSDPGASTVPPRSCLDGRDAVANLAALGWAALGGLLAVAGTRGLGRVVAGVALALLGGAATTVVVGFLLDPGGTVRARHGLPGTAAADVSAWPWVALAGAVAVTVAGGLVAVRGRGWPVLGARYERRPADPAAAMWDDLDRGVDPTA